MTLPAALLQRLAQRGLVQKGKSKSKKAEKQQPAAVESEEVIAEDYDEMVTDDHRTAAAREEYQLPPLYDNEIGIKRVEENFWIERMKERMGEANSTTGHRGCPNKYNIWHKCTLFCVNRWGDGKSEPSREYLRRYKRLRRKYPLPKGWSERYDPGCGCFYFFSIAENLVSWLPPTHPNSQVTKSAAVFRRQLEETAGGETCGGGSDGEQQADDDIDTQETELARHQREIDEIINSSMRPRSPVAAAKQDFPSLQESVSAPAVQRKQKSRDLDRTIAKQKRERGGDKEREHSSSAASRRHHIRGETEKVDPMDPSSYSDIPRGKWSDGLVAASGGDEQKKGKKPSGAAKESARERDKRAGARRDSAN